MRRTVPGLALVVALLVSGAVAPAAASSATASALGVTTRFVDIVASDNVVLKANVIEPTTPGPHPAIVFPSSWGLNDLEYLAQARKLAEGGYTVLSYTPRGWWTSGGRIDTAGPRDMIDVSNVLDWLVARTTADPSRIGMAGVSYGAGISLIGSALDPRVKAVAAMSAWTDLVSSLYGDDTRRLQSSALLVGAAALVGRTSAEFDARIGDFYNNRNIAAVKEFARIRSAGTYLPQLQVNRPAILIANGYGDSIFPPNQLVDFYNAYTGPKRLEFAAGDHAIPELTGLIGLPNHVWTSVRRWFDRHLMGIANGIDTEPSVVLRSMNGGAVESFPNWAATSSSTVRYGLGSVSWVTGTGVLGGSPSTGWSRRAWISGDTVAKGGVVLLSNGLQALTGEPPTAWMPAVDRDNAGVWISNSTSALKIRGAPTVRLRITPNDSSGTLVAYLYDVDWSGTGRLITHAPVTWLGASTSSARDLTLRLPAVSWDVPSGHKLALVVDGHDGLYFDENQLFSSVLFNGQSWVDIPLR